MPDTLTLSTIVEWARRSGGDALSRTFENMVAPGGVSQFQLLRSGHVQVTSLQVDGVEVDDPADYSQIHGLITFVVAPAASSGISVSYAYATYSDDDIVMWLEDAARFVSGDLNADWVIDAGVLTSEADTFTYDIQSLIVTRMGIMTLESRMISSAGQAVMVTDGDTKIDMGGRSGNQYEGRVASLRTAYNRLLDRVTIRRSKPKGWACQDHH